MFKCAKGHISKPGEKRTLSVVERRDRIYTQLTDEGEVEVGRGWEIKKEESLCPEHADVAANQALLDR